MNIHTSPVRWITIHHRADGRPVAMRAPHCEAIRHGALDIFIISSRMFIKLADTFFHSVRLWENKIFFNSFQLVQFILYRAPVVTRQPNGNVTAPINVTRFGREYRLGRCDLAALVKRRLIISSIRCSYVHLNTHVRWTICMRLLHDAAVSHFIDRLTLTHIASEDDKQRNCLRLICWRSCSIDLSWQSASQK